MKSIKIIFFVIALGLSSGNDSLVAQKLFIQKVNELKNSLDENSPEFKCHLEKLGIESLEVQEDLNLAEIDGLIVKRVKEAISIVDRICYAHQREFKRIRGNMKNLSLNSTFVNNLDCFRAELKLYEYEEPELPGYDYGDFIGKECQVISNPAKFYRKHFDEAELKKCSFDEFLQPRFVRKVQLYGLVVPLMDPNMSEGETDKFFKIFTNNFIKIYNFHLDCILRELRD